jgi:ABC-2 type transport system permease protein
VSGVLRAELVRLRVRRFTWLVLVVVTIVSASVAVYAWSEARHPTATEIAAAHEAYQEDVARWAAEGLARCEKTSRDAVAQGVPGLDCDRMGPTAESYVLDQPSFRDDGVPHLGQLAAPVVIGALLLGASLVTAEFGAGSMGLWLTFVAPRARAFRAKAAAAGVGGAAVGLLAGAVGAGGTAIAFAVLHRLHPGAASAVGATAGALGRLALLGALAGVVGAGLGFALRHVAVVMGVALWWVLSVELVAPLAWARAQPLTLGLNVRAWVDGRATYTVQEWVPDPTLAGALVRGDVDHVVGALQGGLVLALAAAVVTAVGLVVFCARDVT